MSSSSAASSASTGGGDAAAAPGEEGILGTFYPFRFPIPSFVADNNSPSLSLSISLSALIKSINQSTLKQKIIHT